MISFFRQLVFGQERGATAGTFEVSHGIDSALLWQVDRVSDAIEELGRGDIHPATVRELVDRSLRAVGSRVTVGTLSAERFAPLEEAARNFLYQHYVNGITDPTGVQVALNSFGRFSIEKKSRNLAANVWEPQIYSRMYDMYVQMVSTGTCQPVVVSVAWGGLEPALLLSALLSAPLVHAKSDERGNVRAFNCQTLPEEGEYILVEDRVRMGKHMDFVADYVSLTYQPRSMQFVVVVE